MIFHRLMMSCGEVKSFVTGNKRGVLAAILSMGGTAGEGLPVATETCVHSTKIRLEQGERGRSMADGKKR